MRHCKLTPTHLLRQLEASWLRKGHTTSLLVSVMEKDEVREDRGGILTPPVVTIWGAVGGGL